MTDLFSPLDELAKQLPGYPAEWSGRGAGDSAYRYTLWRVVRRPVRSWVQIVGLNPSTATEETNDPTIRRLMSFVKSWGHDAFCMTNAFAFRATDPAYKKTVSDPVGKYNDCWLQIAANMAALRVAAWGAHGQHMGRDAAAYRILRAAGPVHCLGLTDGGQPRHPLYLPGFTVPQLWERGP